MIVPASVIAEMRYAARLVEASGGWSDAGGRRDALAGGQGASVAAFKGWTAADGLVRDNSSGRDDSVGGEGALRSDDPRRRDDDFRHASDVGRDASAGRQVNDNGFGSAGR